MALPHHPRFLLVVGVSSRGFSWPFHIRGFWPQNFPFLGVYAAWLRRVICYLAIPIYGLSPYNLSPSMIFMEYPSNFVSSLLVQWFIQMVSHASLMVQESLQIYG